MTTLRTAAQQALEVLEDWDSPVALPAMVALKAALAEPVQEPVAWTGYDLEGMVEAFSRVIEAHHSSKHPFHNPIDMDAQMALRILRGFIPAMKAYAAPPQRKPLTDEEIERLYITAKTPMAFARSIERAHGITS